MLRATPVESTVVAPKSAIRRLMRSDWYAGVRRRRAEVHAKLSRALSAIIRFC
jgi:hypothetical protein